MNLITVGLLGVGGFLGLKALAGKDDDPPTRVGPGGTEPQRPIEGAVELDDESIQRKWTHPNATVALVTMPSWVKYVDVVIRVEVVGRRLELDNTKTNFNRCGHWRFLGEVKIGGTLPATEVARIPGQTAAVLNGGYVPLRVTGCGDGGDDWASLRANNAANNKPPPIWQAGTPWWLRARARISLGRKLEVQLIYPTDAFGASNKDGGQFRGNQYNIDVGWVLRGR